MDKGRSCAMARWRDGEGAQQAGSVEGARAQESSSAGLQTDSLDPHQALRRTKHDQNSK